jgi:hypothetical protein
MHPKFLAAIFDGKNYESILKKHVLGYILGYFFTNSSGHLGSKRQPKISKLQVPDRFHSPRKQKERVRFLRHFKMS